MTAAELLQTLRDLDVDVADAGEKLKVEAFHGVLDDELRSTLRREWSAVLALLKEEKRARSGLESDTGSDSTRSCGDASGNEVVHRSEERTESGDGNTTPAFNESTEAVDSVTPQAECATIQGGDGNGTDSPLAERILGRVVSPPPICRLVEGLVSCGVWFKVEGDQVQLLGDVHLVTPELRRELSRRQDELIALLRKTSDEMTVVERKAFGFSADFVVLGPDDPGPPEYVPPADPEGGGVE